DYFAAEVLPVHIQRGAIFDYRPANCGSQGSSAARSQGSPLNIHCSSECVCGVDFNARRSRFHDTSNSDYTACATDTETVIRCSDRNRGGSDVNTGGNCNSCNDPYTVVEQYAVPRIER